METSFVTAAPLTTLSNIFPAFRAISQGIISLAPDFALMC